MMNLEGISLTVWLLLFHVWAFGTERSLISALDSSYTLTRSETKYMIGDSTLKQTVLTITNISDKNIWCLLDSDTTKTDREIVRYRVLSSIPFDGIPLIKLFSELVIWKNFHPEIFSYFLKIIAPKAMFHIVIITPTNVDIDEILKTIRVMSSTTIDNIFGGLSDIDPKVEPTYQPDILTIPLGFDNLNSAGLGAQ